MIEMVRADARCLPFASGVAQTCITSPPYYQLRSYGVDRQIGLEPTVEMYVSEIVACMREVWRVLRDDGTAWVVLGDSYNASPAGNKTPSAVSQTRRKRVVAGLDAYNTQAKRLSGIKSKDLLGVPWMVAFALRADGWYLRSDIIYSKPNPMPESVTDRPTRAHEYVFLLSKRASYYYDADAIREAFTPCTAQVPRLLSTRGHQPSLAARSRAAQGQADRDRSGGYPTEHAGRNKRSVWTINSEPTPDAHFAVFPQKLVEPMILAGSRAGDLVIDPFAGSATVGRVCARLQRRFAGCDLNPAYFEIARRRTSRVQVEMFA